METHYVFCSAWSGSHIQSYLELVITFWIASNLLSTGANVILFWLITLVFFKLLFCLLFSFTSVFLICHTEIVKLCLNIPITFAFVVQSVHAPMLIFDVAWMLLSIGSLNEVCRLTCQNVLMCFSLSSLDNHIILTSSLSSISTNWTLYLPSTEI